jgi:hypothetical protein
MATPGEWVRPPTSHGKSVEVERITGPGGITNESIPAKPAHTTTKLRLTAAGPLRPWSLNQYRLSCQLHRPRVRVLHGDLLTTFGRVIRRHRPSFPEAAGCDRVRRNSLLDQIVAHRLGPAFRSCRLYSSLPTLSVCPSTARCRLGYSSAMPKTLARRSRAALSRSKLPLLNNPSEIFAIKPRAESRVESTVLSCCKRRARNSCFFFFGLLAKPIGLCRRLPRPVRFHSQSLLLGDGLLRVGLLGFPPG